MLQPKINIIYDRRNKSSQSKTGGIDIEVNFNYKQKFIATGINILPKEWNNNLKRVKGEHAVEYNALLNSLIERAQKILSDMIENDCVCLNTFAEMMRAKEDNTTFLEYCEERIAKKVITETTREKYGYWFKTFKEWGKMVYFADVTVAKVWEYDEWLHTQTDRRRNDNKHKFGQGTIYNYHKDLKSIIVDAVKAGKLKENPYVVGDIHIKKGVKDNVDYLTFEQLETIKGLKYVGYMKEIQDLFLLQCYTGTAYSDMYLINRDGCRETKYGMLYSAKRKKTGVRFTVLLTNDAVEILDKYDWVLPKICNQDYNKMLKVIGQSIGEPSLHSHQARGAFATILLNKGLPLEVLQKTLGHSNIKMTQHYASMLDDTVGRLMAGM